MDYKFRKSKYSGCSKFYLLLFVSIISISAHAQNQITSDSLKLDSLNKANQQKIYNDSVAASKNQAAVSEQSATKKRDTRPLSERIDFDINTSFWVNTSNLFFEFSPVVSYRFPKVISIGVGPTYCYNRDKNIDETLNGWGGKVFTKADLTKWFYAYTEYQGINNQYISGIENNNVVKDYHYVDSWFLSLGINIHKPKDVA